MIQRLPRQPLVTLLLALVLINTSISASASDITVSDPWVREAPPGASALAAYMVVENHGPTERVLSAVSSPISNMVEMHRSLYRDGIASMEQQQQITIPPAGTVEFAAGGYHVMVMNPAPLKAGDQAAFTLHFKNGETITVEAEVRRVMGGQGHQHHH